MNVRFIEPPASRRIGGVETALSGMAGALSSVGVHVIRGESATKEEIGAADLVHFHGLWEVTHRRLRALCREVGTPFIVSPHGMLEPWALRHRGWKKWPYFHLLERPSLNSAAGLLATSPLEARSLARWFAPSQIHTLPLGVKSTPGPDHAGARRDLSWKDDSPVVVFLSRLHEKKGLHLLVRAWKSIPHRANARLVIVGDGASDYVDPLKAECGSDPSIEWVGPRWGADKWPYLQGADLYCLPSYSENFGLTVLEALLVGTPVLTTAHTPWGELGSGLPVHLTETSVPALAHALMNFFRSPQARERVETHRQVVTRYGWSILATEYRSLYQSHLQPIHAR